MLLKTGIDRIRLLLELIMPRQVRAYIRGGYLLKIYYCIFGHPSLPLETSKAMDRRLSEGFFENYCQGCGIDIGYGGVLVSTNCMGYDVEDGDAQYLRGIEDSKFDFVYSSHLLEHLPDPAMAVRNWWRVLKRGGYLILYVPHRDLYEKKKTLPSRWNADHKHFFYWIEMNLLIPLAYCR